MTMTVSRVWQLAGSLAESCWLMLTRCVHLLHLSYQLNTFHCESFGDTHLLLRPTLVAFIAGPRYASVAVRPSSVVCPVVISRKLSKVDPQLLCNIVRKLAPFILMPHSDPLPDVPPLGRSDRLLLAKARTTRHPLTARY